MDTAAAWEAHAQEWLVWTDPDVGRDGVNSRDGFWDTTWPAMQALLPEPRGLTLDLGCGEGRGARELLAVGHRVVGVDTSPTLARAAHDRGTTVLVADARRLPIASHSISLCFACMSLLDIEDLESALSEVDRVLAPTGALVAAIVHPTASMFDLPRKRADELVLPAPYLTERRYDDRAERDGVAATFSNLHRPLSAYFAPLFASGFAITGFSETGRNPVPWCLAFRAERR